MNEVASFERALRAAVPTHPDPRIGWELVPRLAHLSRTATLEGEARARRRVYALRSGVRARSRRTLIARVGIAVAAIPLVFAGLAFAGVTVPGPARDAFDSLGITLPNQPSEEHGQTPAGESNESQGGGNDVSDAAKTKKVNPTQQGNSAAAHQHAREQRAKAKGKAVGHDRGKAIGLNEATPPGQSGDTGPPAHSNAGGSARSQSVRQAPEPRVGTPTPRSHPFSPVNNLRGHSK